MTLIAPRGAVSRIHSALGSSGSAADVRGLLQVHACTRGDIVGRQLSASWRRASKGSRVAAPLTRVSSPAIEQPIGQWKRARFGAGIERQRCRRERLAASARLHSRRHRGPSAQRELVPGEQGVASSSTAHARLKPRHRCGCGCGSVRRVTRFAASTEGRAAMASGVRTAHGVPSSTLGSDQRSSVGHSRGVDRAIDSPLVVTAVGAAVAAALCDE